MKFILIILFFLGAQITFAESGRERNRIYEITSEEISADSRYYPKVLVLETINIKNSVEYNHRSHCPNEDLKILAKRLSKKALNKNSWKMMGDLKEPLKYWNLSPECFEVAIHDQKNNAHSTPQGIVLGAIAGAGEGIGVSVGVELVLIKLDSETMSIGLFAFLGGGFSLSLSPITFGSMQALLEGDCSDGVFSYEGGFTSVNLGFRGWSFSTGDFPPLKKKFNFCSSFVELSGVAGASLGLIQSYYSLISPYAYKIRGEKITKIIHWLDQAKLKK